jgi:hypothetical protein
MPKEDGYFKKGNKMGKGRIPGSKNRLSMAREFILDTFEKGEKKFVKALEEELDRNPLKYYKELMVPFNPKEFKVDAEITNHERGDINEITKLIDEIAIGKSNSNTKSAPLAKDS